MLVLSRPAHSILRYRTTSDNAMTDFHSDSVSSLDFGNGALEDVFTEGLRFLLDSSPMSMSMVPSSAPSTVPSSIPSNVPSSAPSKTPSSAPSSTPSSTPSKAPTEAPTNTPTNAPSSAPSSAAPISSPISSPISAPISASTSGQSGASAPIPTSSPNTGTSGISGQGSDVNLQNVDMCTDHKDYFAYTDARKTFQYEYIAQIRDSSNEDFAVDIAKKIKQVIRDNHCESKRKLTQGRRLEGGTLIGFEITEPTVKPARCTGTTSNICVVVTGDVNYAISDESGKTTPQNLKAIINKIIKEYKDTNVVETSVPAAANRIPESEESTNTVDIVAIVFSIIGVVMLVAGVVLYMKKRNKSPTSTHSVTKENCSEGTDSDNGNSLDGHIERLYNGAQTAGGSTLGASDASTVVVKNVKAPSKYVDVEM